MRLQVLADFTQSGLEMLDFRLLVTDTASQARYTCFMPPRGRNVTVVTSCQRLQYQAAQSSPRTSRHTVTPSHCSSVFSLSTSLEYFAMKQGKILRSLIMLTRAPPNLLTVSEIKRSPGDRP